MKYLKYFTLKVLLNFLMLTKIAVSILFAVYNRKIGLYLSDGLNMNGLNIRSENVRH